MSMPFPLPAGTALAKSFEYGLDINLGTYASPIWQPARRISGYSPTFPPTEQDAQTYDDQGAPNQDIIARGFAASFTIQGNRSLSSGRYLPEVEAIMAAGKGTGEAAVLDVRFYHKPAIGTPNPDDAGRALVTVEISRSETGNAGIENTSVSIKSKGVYTPITNPYSPAGASSVAVVRTVSPAGRTAGQQVTLVGERMLAATEVRFGSTPATSITVVSDGTIVAVVPAGSAGTVNVTVITPAGTSAAVPYTRGA